MSVKTLIETQIMELSDEVEERLAAIRALKAQLPSIDIGPFHRDAKATRADCCPTCGTRLSLLNGLSDDGW